MSRTTTPVPLRHERRAPVPSDVMAWAERAGEIRRVTEFETPLGPDHLLSMAKEG